MNEQKPKRKISKILLDLIEETAYICILVPLIIVSLQIVWQSITEPDKIPSFFGYKIFIILDKYMDDSVEHGDLVITKNIETTTLEVNDIIAFRNGTNTVTIHKILNIEEGLETDNITNEKRTVRTFTMNTLKNETLDTKYVKDDKVEGILVNKVPKVGKILYMIQQPLIMIPIGCVILIIGLIWIYIAQELDKKEKIKTEEKQMHNNEPKETT